jgi:Ger(x)C family germination protein
MFSTGCWDAKDVKDLTIPTLQGFDYQPEADKYVSYISYPVFVQNQKKSDVLRSEGQTMGEIDTQRSNQSERVVSLGDLKGFILGKEFATYGTEILDVLFRNPMLSLTQQMAVVDGEAEEIFKLQPPHSESIGDFFIEIFRNSPKNNFIPNETVYNFMVNSVTPGFNPVLPVIQAQKDDIKITGAALFKKHKMVAMINAKDMQVLTWLRGEKKQGNISFELSDDQGKLNKLTFKGSNKRKVKAWLEDEVPVFEVEIKLEGVIMEVLGNYRFAGEEQHVEMAQRALEKKVKRQCESLVEDLQYKYQVDAILLGKYARIYWPEKVQQQDWDENFCNSIINVKVKATIYGTGEMA